MKIAFFSDNFYPELSGIADSITTTAEELARRGHEIHFFAPTYSRANYKLLDLPRQEPFLQKRISVSRLISFPFPTGTSQGRVVIPLGKSLRLLKKSPPDILHAHLPFGVGLDGLFAARHLRKPLVGTNHTPTEEFIHYSPWQPRWLKNLSISYTTWFYNQCAFVSSPAQAIIDEMRLFGFQAPGAPVSNPLHLSFFYPLKKSAALKKKFHFSPYMLLYAGRLASEKRVDLVIQTVARLAPRLPIGAAILGRGQDEERLRRMAKELGVADRIHFFGFLKDERDMNEIYNACDTFIMMSTAETQSIVTMHAMACGLSVVVANSWGLKEYVRPQRGILVKPGDVETLIKKVSWLYEHEKERKVLGEQGKLYVSQFSVKHVAEKWEGIYESILQGKTPRLRTR